MSTGPESPEVMKRHIETLKARLGPVFLSALEDPLTVEIMLNPDGSLWQEKLGQKQPERIGQIDFYSSMAAMQVIATCLGTELTKENPIIEGEFPIDNSRFAGQIPPAVAAPTFAIRKKASQIFTLEQYVESEIMTKVQYDVICENIINHQNILVVGGTGSGKTTLINGIIDKMVEINPEERILIMEDTGEIQCSAINNVTYHTTLNVSLTDLLKTSLRMRPDRILVGEVRDHAALDLLDAWNTGHEGGCATIHANNAMSALNRIRGLVTRNPHAPRIVEEVIGEAVHLIVFISRVPEGGRKIQEIIKINGYENGQYVYEYIGI